MVARVTCPCGMEVDLHRGRYEDGPYWELWEELPPDLPPGESVLLDELLRERAAVAAFTEVIECACGRRWRGVLDPPQVIEDGAEPESAAVLQDRWNFHTTGPNCHWCYHRDTAFVWGPYGTNLCAVCQELIEAGRQWEIAEALAAEMTVRGRWLMLDPERWRKREHGLLERWLEVRTTCRPATPS